MGQTSATTLIPELTLALTNLAVCKPSVEVWSSTVKNSSSNQSFISMALILKWEGNVYAAVPFPFLKFSLFSPKNYFKEENHTSKLKHGQ